MIDAYNLRLSCSDFASFLEKGKNYYRSNATFSTIRYGLEKVISKDGSIDATKLQADWFPQVDTDVFISHSHRDKNLAIALSGWLNCNFGIKPFVDSCVWGYADKLLKKIDDRYCKTNIGYSYKKRNVSTTHVHMMLFSALMEMIAKSQCIFFLNTPNSLSAIKTNNGYTNSAWIYAELLFAKILKEQKQIEKSFSSIFFNIRYKLDLGDFCLLTQAELYECYNSYLNKKGEDPLQILRGIAQNKQL